MKPAGSSQRLALVALILGAMSSAFTAVLIRLCLFPAPVIASLRILLAGLVITPFCWKSLRQTLRERAFAELLLLITPGVVLGLHFQFWVAGIKTTTVASGTFVFSLNPIFFAVAERFLYRRKLSVATYLSLVLVAAGGLWLLGLGGVGFGTTGDLLCFVSMLLFVLYLLLSRKLSASVPHLSYIQIIYFWGGLLTLPLAMIRGELFHVNWGNTASIMALLALIAFPTLIGHTAFNFAVRHISPLTASFFTLFEPVTNTVAAALILAEQPTVREVPAYLLFILATLIHIFSSRVPGRRASTFGRRTGSSR